MTTFAHDLETLIAKHLGTPRRADDFADAINDLYAAAERLSLRADRYRFADETALEFKKRIGA